MATITCLKMSTSEELAIQRFLEVLSKQESEQSRTQGLQFRPQADDLLIVTPPKCGTTWVQQIVQSLRSRGSRHVPGISPARRELDMS